MVIIIGNCVIQKKKLNYILCIPYMIHVVYSLVINRYKYCIVMNYLCSVIFLIIHRNRIIAELNI